MAIIEKKYLLKDSARALLKSSEHKKEQISQFYTKIEFCKEIRYRKIDKNHFKTVRTGSEVRKDEIDKKITKASYQKAKSKKIGNILKKERYTIDKHSAIDFYKKELNNILLFEVAFKTLSDAQTYTLPASLLPHIKRDVSEDKRYRSKNLACLGNPYKIPYNIYAIFKDIEQGRVKEVQTVIFPEMIVSDAVRIILFKLYHDLQKDSQKLIEKNNIKSLERFRKNLKKTKILLNEYRTIFDATLYQKVYAHLGVIENSIAIDKDLSVIRAHLPLLESAFTEKEINRFITRIDKRIEDEKHKVQHFFKTREYKIIFSQFKLLITEPSNIFTAYYSNTSIAKASHATIAKRFKKLCQLSKKYDKCHDLDAYNKIKKALNKTRVLLGSFSSLYEQKRYVKMCALLENTYQKLMEYIELHKRTLIIQTYIQNSDKSLQEQEKLIKKIEKRRKNLEKVFNKQIDLTLENLIEHKKLFKK
jgi:CYTH domain-containing protein